MQTQILTLWVLHFSKSRKKWICLGIPCSYHIYEAFCGQPHKILNTKRILIKLGYFEEQKTWDKPWKDVYKNVTLLFFCFFQMWPVFVSQARVVPGIARPGNITAISTTLMPLKAKIVYLESRQGGWNGPHLSLFSSFVFGWLWLFLPKAQERHWWDLLGVPKWGEAAGEKAWSANLKKVTFFQTAFYGIAQVFCSSKWA